MSHKDKLLEIYEKSFDVSDVNNISNDLMGYVETITNNIDSNKGVYTVLVTLMVHKLLEPKQDIRYFQDKMPHGFSARTIDTKYITPTLKELGLPSMAESGWLTRSLEQPYPYKLNYKGEISGKGMKESFLKVIDAFQSEPSITENLLRLVLNSAILLRDENHVEIEKMVDNDGVMISTIAEILEKHFTEKYSTHGGSKLPVLAFYAIYKIMMTEVVRYKGCKLLPLGSHTASDRTSNSAGDIEVARGDKIFEAVEIKLDKPVDGNVVRIAYEKIARFNPKRYFILSNIGIPTGNEEEIQQLIWEITAEHGCQLIVNGLVQTLKYYLRLITKPTMFFNEYVQLVEEDTELKAIHKNMLKKLMKEYKI